jgi:isopentenyl diphosphate isomerase/L-lactate dehydrogenase-like FMN-dependent dehydrogenase
MIVSSDSSVPLATIAKSLTTPLWLQVYAKGPKVRDMLAEAVAAKAKAVVVTVNAGASADVPPPPAAAIDWAGVDAVIKGTLLLIEPVVQALGGQVPVLADGSFRRGTDILKALGFGARGVLYGRPVQWGLAAYGAEGVQGVVEMLQTELARYMCMCGRPTLAAVNASLVRVHAPLPAARNNHG